MSIASLPSEFISDSCGSRASLLRIEEFDLGDPFVYTVDRVNPIVTAGHTPEHGVHNLLSESPSCGTTIKTLGSHRSSLLCFRHFIFHSLDSFSLHFHIHVSPKHQFQDLCQDARTSQFRHGRADSLY